MIVIADNLNTRNRVYMEALGRGDGEALGAMARELEAAGADFINVQCSLDGTGDEDVLPWAVEAVCSAAECSVSIDTRDAGALKEALKVARSPAMVNYLSLNEPEDGEEFLRLAARARALLVLRATRGMVPATLEGKLQILETLIEEANAFDIPNERLFLDPSVVHIGRGEGQEHLLNAADAVSFASSAMEPPVNTAMWATNVSAGLPGNLRASVEASFLTYMAGAGLDAAFMDVLSPELIRAVYMIRSFRDEIVFSPSELS